MKVLICFEFYRMHHKEISGGVLCDCVSIFKLQFNKFSWSIQFKCMQWRSQFLNAKFYPIMIRNNVLVRACWPRLFYSFQEVNLGNERLQTNKLLSTA